MSKKRAQAPDAGNVSLLILILLAGIVMYILLVPPDIRESLLGDNETKKADDNGNGAVTGDAVLLAEHPGRLDYIEDRDYSHEIPALSIYRTVDAMIIARVSQVSVRSAAFDRGSTNISFSIEDLENTDDVMLSFGADKHEGVLTIKLNGYTVFSGDISTYNVDPVGLPRNYLRESNVLEFSVSDTGWMFWATNEYNLRDVKIIAEVTDTSMQEARNVFFISDAEYNNMERAYLKFFPHCDETGRVEIDINGMNVFSGLPDCNILNSYEMAPDILVKGTNRITFITDGGSYLLDRISIKTYLAEVPEAVYYFELTGEQYEDVKRGAKDVNLTLIFVDSTTIKDGLLTINGRELGLYTRSRVYSKIINAYVEAGNNALKVTPRTSLDVSTLLVKLD